MAQLYLQNEYYDWLCNHIKNSNYRTSDYSKLLMFLHSIDFTFTIPLDANRADDGTGLRYRFGEEMGIDPRIIVSELDIFQCSVFEMMVALANRCEVSIMDNPEFGNRTGVWFWEMVSNLGLSHLNNDIFDRDQALDSVNRFLEHRYERDGRYGLFTVKNPRRDMRTTEIWYQAMWYLDEVLQI